MSWPPAIKNDLICNTERAKKSRAADIIDWIVTGGVKKKKFLDFGCGEGYTIAKAKARGAKVAIGYDIEQFEYNDIEVVERHAPYDAVLLYDVLDHCINPVQTLKRIKGLVDYDSEVYVTCHPWLCRHGGHKYKKDNRAFIHLLEEEPITRQKLADGETYQRWFNNAGFEMISCSTRTNYVEEFFLRAPTMSKKIAQIADMCKISISTLIWKMRISFYDFKIRACENPVLKPYPVATIHHVIDGDNQTNHILYSNGKIDNPTGICRWLLSHRDLRLVWPSPDAPGGEWIDYCQLKEDLQAYYGQNQDDTDLWGQVI